MICQKRLDGDFLAPELKNCKRCNRIFTYMTGLPICPACVKEDERIFDEVSEYIRNNPGAPLSTVSKDLDISYEKLLKYVKEGRLQIRAESGGFYRFCEKCGEMIIEGKFCKHCEYRISTVLDASKKNLLDKMEENEILRSDYKFLARDIKKK